MTDDEVQQDTSHKPGRMPMILGQPSGFLITCCGWMSRTVDDVDRANELWATEHLPTAAPTLFEH